MDEHTRNSGARWLLPAAIVLINGALVWQALSPAIPATLGAALAGLGAVLALILVFVGQAGTAGTRPAQDSGPALAGERPDIGTQSPQGNNPLVTRVRQLVAELRASGTGIAVNAARLNQRVKQTAASATR
ncbi:MAG: hypothetical protein CVU25_12215, partial [Betaproteobacteria bacterium HGW-Betaproteobacteria-19]